MPFLLLPDSREASERLLASLAERLCPYTEQPRRCLAAKGYAVWATSLARLEDGAVRSALSDGTARFAVEPVDGGLTVSTDPLGTCPVWYARVAGGWAVAAEAKALAVVTRVRLRSEAELLRPGPRPPHWSPFDGLARLPPGSALRLSGGEARVEGAPARVEVAATEERSREAWARILAETLQRGFAPGEGPTGSFVSGGIDSSIACALARRHGPVSTFSLGSVHGDEFVPARALAESFGCEHAEVHLDPAAVRASFEKVVLQNEVTDGLCAEILLQLSTLYAAARGTCRRVTTGYGSDLLFDGMLRVPEYMQAVGLGTASELIERTRWTGEVAPFVHWCQGIAAEHVFWKPEVIHLALSIPRELCFSGGVEKAVLREAAVASGLLPEALARRPKTPLTAGTRANLLLSAALGIPEPLGYVEKTRACLGVLEKALISL
jgi:asparagine synthetase B (glutamine-hydrolysing)